MTGRPDPFRTFVRGVILAPYLAAAVVYAPVLLTLVLAAALVVVFLLPYAPALRARTAAGEAAPLRQRGA